LNDEMKFSYNWLKELARFKESPEKITGKAGGTFDVARI